MRMLTRDESVCNIHKLKVRSHSIAFGLVASRDAFQCTCRLIGHVRARPEVQNTLPALRSLRSATVLNVRHMLHKVDRLWLDGRGDVYGAVKMSHHFRERCAVPPKTRPMADSNVVAIECSDHCGDGTLSQCTSLQS